MSGTRNTKFNYPFWKGNLHLQWLITKGGRVHGELLGPDGHIKWGIIRYYYSHDAPCVFSPLRHIYPRIKSRPKYPFWKGNLHLQWLITKGGRVHGELLGPDGHIKWGIIRYYYSHDAPCVFSPLKHIYPRIKSRPKCGHHTHNFQGCASSTDRAQPSLLLQYRRRRLHDSSSTRVSQYAKGNVSLPPATAKFAI